MNLGIYGEWTWGTYMEDAYFWEYLFSSGIAAFDHVPFSVIRAQCDAEKMQCLAVAASNHETMGIFCGFAAGAAASANLVGGLITLYACVEGRSWANSKEIRACEDNHARCLLRSY